MNDWNRLGDYVSSSLKGITPKYVTNSSIIVLNQKCIRNNRVDYSFSKFHNGDKPFNENKIVKVGDLLFNSTGQGTAGRCAFVRKLPIDKTVITDSHILIIRIDDYYLSECFSYSLYKEEDLIQSFMDGSTGQGELDKLRLFNIEFKLPSIKYRKNVCVFLNTIDQKIEVNNKINQELESLAKLIYDYWFVQFDFPDANGKPYKSSGGKMVYNAVLKREIPEGWESGTFEDVAVIIGGSTPSKAEKVYYTKDNGTPWITPKDLSINKGKKYITRGEIDVTEKGINKASLKLMPAGTILLSSRAPIGYLAISREIVTTNQGFKSFVPRDYFTSEFLFYQIKNKIPLIEARSSGSTFKEVSASILKGIKIIIPPKKIIEEYQKIIKPIFSKQNLVELENQELASLRDWLLPMLMNGQVTVGEAKEQLGMVAEENVKYGER
ncbi:restriction endonuclease subunit S [uncultured Dokdonia sp.]|uniref:restriction endonuclease subunit S n=1 Tax=uncultured Dokdonia sp. TaxID=575653 RepID=UPI0026278403|nr:restriction endonuclease subunit S [uncultured Dokdonia sp.]